MFKNYLTIAFRNLLINKGYSFLNIFGLALGITCSSLIFLWVENEVNYDTVFQKKDQIYYVLNNQKNDGQWRTFGSTPGLLAQALKDEIPGIVNTTRVVTEESLFNFGDKSLFKRGLYADADFLDIFSLQFIEGNATNAFVDVNGLIITQKTAFQLFGKKQNIVGRTVRMDNEKDYSITGVIADLPENVSTKFDWIAAFEPYAQDKDYLQSWRNHSVDTYIELDQGADAFAINEKIKNFLETKTENTSIYAFLHSMNDWHLRDDFKEGVQTGGRITYVNLFSIIAWIILLIACINFMNLSTARSAKRANEVGVRKVLGAERSRLIMQFISESIVVSAIATMLSILLIFLLLPYFNVIIEKQLEMGLGRPSHLVALLVITLFCGIFAGCYPALYLSSFKPVAILKGIKAKHGGSIFIRKGMVIIQFTASIILIISTIIIYTQVQYVKNRQLGYDKTNLITMDVHGDMIKNFNSIKQDMIATGTVQNVALNSFNTLSSGNNGSGAKWAGKDEADDPILSFRFISPEFISLAGMEIVDGRDFDLNSKADWTQVIITQSLADMMGPGSAVGKTIFLWEEQLEVLGVVDDFLYGDMYATSDPVMFFIAPQEASLMYVKVNPDVPLKSALTSIGKVMEKNNPAFPFEYEFVDDAFNAKFKSEMLVGKLSQLFAILAILISCLGLFGLAAYTSEQRSKEIGVRKVMGAGIASIVRLLSKDFLKLVIISIAIAVPIGWWAMSGWLEEYAYRIDIQWWMLALAGLSALLIALLTVSFQAIKAASANPVKSLRTE